MNRPGDARARRPAPVMTGAADESGRLRFIVRRPTLVRGSRPSHGRLALPAGASPRRSNPVHPVNPVENLWRYFRLNCRCWPPKLIRIPTSRPVASPMPGVPRARTRHQLPPTLRGVRAFGMKPREVLAFQGCSVRGLAARAAVAAAGSGVAAAEASPAAAAASAALAAASSWARQHCLYLRPDPQWHGSLRPGRCGDCALIVRVYSPFRARPALANRYTDNEGPSDLG